MIGIGPHGPTGPGGPGSTGSLDRHGIGEGPSSYPAREQPTAAPHARAAMAVIASVEGIGPVTLERLLAAFGGPVAVLEAAIRPGGSAALRAATQGPEDRLPSMRTATADALGVVAQAPERVLAVLEAAGVHVLLLEDDSYPPRLRQIELPPRLLYVRGDDHALDAERVVAVVGTRRPTDEGRRTAARMGAALARAGALVVSGLALGIDGAAHAAVVGEGRPTAAVIGGGHDRLFPRAHDRLAATIVDAGGAVI